MTKRAAARRTVSVNMDRCSVSAMLATLCFAWVIALRSACKRKRATLATAKVDVSTGLAGCPLKKSRLNLPFWENLLGGHFLSGKIINLCYNRRVSRGSG